MKSIRWLKPLLAMAITGVMLIALNNCGGGGGVPNSSGGSSATNPWPKTFVAGILKTAIADADYLCIADREQVASVNSVAVFIFR